MKRVLFGVLAIVVAVSTPSSTVRPKPIVSAPQDTVSGYCLVVPWDPICWLVLVAPTAIR